MGQKAQVFRQIFLKKINVLRKFSKNWLIDKIKHTFTSKGEPRYTKRSEETGDSLKILT